MDKTRYRDGRLARIEKWTVEFYNQMNPDNPVSRIEDLPKTALDIFAHMEYHQVVAPFVAIDIRDGLSREQAAIKYGVTPGFARETAQRFKYLPRKKTTVANNRLNK